MTIGNSYIIFPVVLSIFVLMIGLGSLTIKKIDIKSFNKTLIFSIIFSLISFIATPYLPLLISNIRVLFISNKIVFYVFHIIVYLIILILLAPAVFYLGRVLPFIYALIPKDKKNYGQRCGNLYFLNTLGTFSGSILLGYLAFYFLDLKNIYIIALAGLIIPGIYFLRQNALQVTIVIVASIISITLPFSRTFHARGPFRYRKPIEAIHFQNIFTRTNKKDSSIIYFNDGPNTTVAITKNKSKKSKRPSKSIFVNGKSDGSTVGDYPTITLLALMPYLATSSNQIKSAVIGIGTGVSAGLLADLERTFHLDMIEISDAVIDSIKFMEPENFNLDGNPKVHLHKNDAFQFFKTTSHHYDIIISEPSNPWVMGVENLFTPYFYKTAKKHLQAEGLFVQWLHTYSMSGKALITVFRNLGDSFKNITIYELGNGDIILMASNRKERLVFKNQSLEKKAAKVLKNMKFPLVKDLNLLEALNSKDVHTLIQTNTSFHHEIFHPQLSQKVYIDFFEGRSSHNIGNLIIPLFKRINTDDRSHLFKRLKKITKKTSCPPKDSYPSPICNLLKKRYQIAVKDIESGLFEKRLDAYSILRHNGFIKKDIGFIKGLFRNLANKPKENATARVSSKIIEELIREREFSFAISFVKKFENLKLIDTELAKQLLSRLKKAKTSYQKWQNHKKL